MKMRNEVVKSARKTYGALKRRVAYTGDSPNISFRAKDDCISVKQAKYAQSARCYEYIER